MLGTLFLIVISLYCSLILFFIIGLYKKSAPLSDQKPFVSIIIPAKNEEHNISNILHDLSRQTYPLSSYEVIIVDDESSDNTSNVIKDFLKKLPNLQLLSTAEWESSLRYKKRPLYQGIRHSKGEILLLTDADCRVAPQWVSTMVSSFTDNVGMVIGYSGTAPAINITQKLEALDFLMLMSAARGSASLGIPYACTGQNLAYRRRVFDEVGGFSTFASQVGGDDTLLLQQIKLKTKWKIAFASHPDSFITSRPQETLLGFFSQRIRWAADALPVWKTDPLFFSIIVLTFCANFLALVLPWAAVSNSVVLPPVIISLSVKMMLEGILMLKGTELFNRYELRLVFLPWFFLQIPYIAAMGILSFLGNRLPWGRRQSR